jgi:hypothetical protein
MRLVLVAVVGAAVLAGCGGDGSVDRGGFTAGDRKAAQDALGVLARTAVWGTAAKVSYTQGKPPTACVIHIQKAKPLTFKVLMTWIPVQGFNTGRTYAWLEAVIGPEGLKRDYHFRFGNELTENALKTRYGDAFAKPVEKCLVLQNNKFGLLSSD